MGWVTGTVWLALETTPTEVAGVVDQSAGSGSRLDRTGADWTDLPTAASRCCSMGKDSGSRSCLPHIPHLPHPVR